MKWVLAAAGVMFTAAIVREVRARVPTPEKLCTSCQQDCAKLAAVSCDPEAGFRVCYQFRCDGVCALAAKDSK